MTKSRIWLLLFVAASTVLLYMLPRYVVNNTEQDIQGGNANPNESESQPIDDHSIQISDTLLVKIYIWHESYKNAESHEKRIIFADSLAKTYKIVGKLDSLAKYTEVRAIINPSNENLIIAGDSYYQAFTFAIDQPGRKYLAEKTQEYYKRVLEENASLLNVKSKLAMTYVIGANPMHGIMMLREVLEEDSENELAIYNLGILAINSGQLDKAIERFEKLKQINSSNPEAHFYLGYCLFELGKLDKSRPHFEKVLELGITGDLMNASEDYLNRINK